MRRRSPLRLRSLLTLGAVLLAGSAAHAAGELKARLVGFEGLRPSVYAAASASGNHLYTLREFDPLVPAKFNAVCADPEDDLTLAVYGPGDAAFGAGQTIRLAGARALPATVVVPQGTAVLFRNDDPFVHHIVGPGIDNDLKPGESHKVQPKGKGTFVFTDSMFPSVKSWVVVDDGVIADRFASQDGAVKIALEGNEYTLKVFFEGAQKGAVNNFKVADKGTSDAKDITVGPAAAAAPGK